MVPLMNPPASYDQEDLKTRREPEPSNLTRLTMRPRFCGSRLDSNQALPSATPSSSSSILPRESFRRKHADHYRVPPHPNTAKSLTSIWTVSRNLSQGAKPFLDMGLHVKRQAKLNRLETEYIEFQVGHGTILVLAPSKDDDKMAKFIQQRGEQAVLGASFKVSSLSSARQVLDKHSVEYSEHTGIYGFSLLLDPSRTNGFWLEMYEE